MNLLGFAERFVDHTTNAPNRPALSSEKVTWSYAELWRTAGNVADELLANGAVPGRPVAVWSPKSPEMIATIIGCGIAGLPVIVPSVDMPRAAVDSMLVTTGSSHLVSVAGPTDPGNSVALRIERLADGEDQHGRQLASTPLILATSGSTGAPKIVPLSAAGVARFFAWSAGMFGISAGTRVLSYAPLNFDLSLLDVWTTLWAGGTVTLVEHDRAAEAKYLRQLLTGHDVEVVQAVPLFVRLVTDAGHTFPAVRRLIVTGDVLPPALLPRIRSAFPNALVYNLYGCTETNDSLLHEIESFEPSASAVPIGRPISGVHAALLDDEQREIDGPGIGELVVSTPFQADGYLDERLTRQQFVTRTVAGRPLPFYRTGDVVRRDEDGRLHLQGRDDFHVKVRGVRTNMQEVEQVLQQHPGVLEAAVVAIPDDTAGHQLHATLRVDGVARVNSLHLRSHCSSILVRTAIPSTFDIRTQPLPRTSTGKVDRHLIEANYQKEVLS